MYRLLVLLMLTVVAGCGGARVDESADAGAALAQPASPPATSTPAQPAKTERGLLSKQLGEIAGITNDQGDQVIRFAVEAITVDPMCNAEFASKPEHGHFVAVRMNIETTAQLNPQTTIFHPDAWQFSIQGPDGFTDGAVGTGAGLGCLTTQEQLPADNIGPAGKYAGSIVLDTKYTSGILMFKPYALGADGWEWTFGK
jgi:hypothetical protein